MNYYELARAYLRQAKTSVLPGWRTIIVIEKNNIIIIAVFFKDLMEVGLDGNVRTNNEVGGEEN